MHNGLEITCRRPVFSKSFCLELPMTFYSHHRVLTGKPLNLTKNSSSLDIGNHGCLPFIQKNPNNSDGVQMERLILSARTEIFSGKPDFLRGRLKFPNRIFQWKTWVPFAIFTSTGPFGLDRL